MPKKKNLKKKETDAPKSTYHKSKNGRYYRKTTMANGKSQCRFVSKSEGEAALAGKKKAKTQTADSE